MRNRVEFMPAQKWSFVGSVVGGRSALFEVSAIVRPIFQGPRADLMLECKKKACKSRPKGLLRICYRLVTRNALSLAQGKVV
jgi:hypothetical protein